MIEAELRPVSVPHSRRRRHQTLGHSQPRKAGEVQPCLHSLPAFANEDPEVLDRIVEFLLQQGILFGDGTRLKIGDAGKGPTGDATSSS